jgi:hypothetical protein
MTKAVSAEQLPTSPQTRHSDGSKTMETIRKAKAGVELQLRSQQFTPYQEETLDEAPQEVELY